MSLSASTVNRLALALTSKDAAKELVGELLGGNESSKSTAVIPVTITATTGTLPTAGSTATVANAASPTNEELLQIVVDLQANVVALQAILHAQGLTT
jgi:hypothetical protein